MLNPKFALIPGSFDPPTIGHYDIVARAAGVFDEVWVIAFSNSTKNGMLSPEQKLRLLRTAFADFKNVHVDVSDGLLAGYAEEKGIGTIIKGARSATDFDYEMSMSLINRSLNAKLDTFIIPTKSEYMHISSTMVKEMIRYGMDYSRFVPEGTAELLAEFVNTKK